MVKQIMPTYPAQVLVERLTAMVYRGYPWVPSVAKELYRLIPSVQSRSISFDTPVEYGIMPYNRNTPVWFNFAMGEDQLIHATVPELGLETSFDPYTLSAA